LALLKKSAAAPQKGSIIVLTNAGYAEVNGTATQGALDGLTTVTGASRGRNTLIEINSSSRTPLWFAVFDRASGLCAYLELDPSEATKWAVDAAKISAVFAIEAIERIDANHLFQNASEYEAKFNRRIFGGNEFRIVTIANAVAAGAPAYVIRTIEYHNHFCPGVTSGILMALYVKNNFSAGKSGYFVHTLEPWCKEDALMLLLNATPATESYAVSYPADADKAARSQEAKNASTIIYRKNEKSNRWEGLVLAFEWPDTACPKRGGVTDKLCADLWYLGRLGKPEEFVKVVKRFELPDGISPKDWTKPGTDPLRKLGLAK
jgi:formylmethanofuran dehydrogenase subunit E-like metal-binding protein